MDGMEAKLQQIMGDPDMMQKIMSIAQGFQSAPQEAPPPPSPMPDIDMATIQKIASFASQSNIDKNQRNLLAALGPYLSQNRISKLEKDGIIQEYNLRLNREVLGYHIIAYVQLEMDPSLKPKFHEQMIRCNNVLECCNVTGQYSQILKVAFKSTVDLDSFLTRIQAFGRTSTHIVLSAHIPPRDNLIDCE